MVCTEIYLRRVRNEEIVGQGRGVLWEARIIRQLLYESGSVSAKFVPILFSDGSETHVPLIVKSGTIHQVETDEGYDALCRLLTNQPATPAPPVGEIRSLPPLLRQVASGPSLGSASLPPTPTAEQTPVGQPLVSTAHPRVADIFVGRWAQLDRLATLIFPAGATRRPAVVSGMAGVGKSYLADRFYWDQRDHFPGGYIRLPLDPQNPLPAADLLANLADRVKVPGGDPAALAARLQAPATLVHIENADTPETGRVVAEIAAQLPGCALIFSARFRGLGASAGWGQVELLPFDEKVSLEQLDAELPETRDRGSWPALAAALGYLPLALHLAAGHLRAGHRADVFLRRLRQRKLALESADPADPVFRERSRALLSDTFDLSLTALQRAGGGDGNAWAAGLAALGHAPAAGFGESLGATIADLTPEMFLDLADEAVRLSVLDRVSRGPGFAYRLHPLLAELVRSESDRDTAFAHTTEWFIARLPMGNEDDQGRRWNEVNEEFAALTEWLGQLSAAERVRVQRAGGWYAMHNGPFHAWMRFCEEMLAGELDDAARSDALWTLGQVALHVGDLGRALVAAAEKRDLDNRRDDERGAALAASLIADILWMRDDLDETLRVRREEVLPVFERLGDVREVAVTKGKIADIIFAQGELDEALRIRREEELPVYERLGEVREAAVTQRKIADVLARRGELEEALHILRDKALLALESFGATRDAAVIKGQIADILQMRGDVDEALRIYLEEELPVYERLGDAREAALTKGKIADIMETRNLDDALRIRREEQVPVFERLGDARSASVAKWKIGLLLLERDQVGDRTEAETQFRSAIATARRLRVAEVPQLEEMMRQLGLDPS